MSQHAQHKRKLWRKALRDLVKKGIGFNAEGAKVQLKDRGNLSGDRSLLAGYKFYEQLSFVKKAKR